MAATAGIDKGDLDMILTTLDDYRKNRLTDEALLELDKEDRFPTEIITEMCTELGIQLLFIPEQYDGMGGSSFDIYRICEAMARIDVGIATGLFATFLGSEPIFVGGTPEQKKKWISLISEGSLFAYGASEPAAGSDLAALKTTATPVEEDGQVVGYKLNGSKQWISNGGYADVITILAKAPGGPSWFIIEKDAEGFEAGKPEEKHGIRLSNTAALNLDDVPVGTDRLIGGEEGKGLSQALAVFGYTRLMVAAFGLGAGCAAQERAIVYATERKQAGKPLAQLQGFTHKLIVPHMVRLEGARAYIEEVSTRLDSGEDMLNTEGAIAKLLATEAGNEAADAAIQAHGGYGYTHEYMVEKIKRDVRITTIYEGTSEIMERSIGSDRWRLHLQSRGQYYHDKAKEMEQLHGRNGKVGADVAALGLHALATLLERARAARLTRQQHIQFRLGELMAFAEGSAAMCKRADEAASGTQNPKTDKRFDAAALAAISRVYARDAAGRIANEGLAWVVGADAVPAAELPAFTQQVGAAAITRAQAGMLADMDVVRDAIFSKYDL